MAKRVIEWTDDRYLYTYREGSDVVRRLRTGSDPIPVHWATAAKAMLAEIELRGKEIEQQSEIIAARGEEILRQARRLESCRELQPGEAIGRGIVEALLPHLPSLVQELGMAIGKAASR